jgi:hypothetical protein
MRARILEPEWLDSLPAEDNRAARSREDLRRMNRLLGHSRILQKFLRYHPQPVRCLVELGAGDGTLLLRLARELAPVWGRVRVRAIDRQPCFTSKTVDAFARLGWSLELIKDDVSEGLARLDSEDPAETVMIANLFLHHFSDEELRLLFLQSAAACSLFVACEPRRSSWALGASRCLGVLGCSHVTRHDGVASVRAGFTERELSALWPAQASWELHEGCARVFSHFFAARRRAR